MKVLCHFSFKSQAKESAPVEYDGTIYDFNVEHAFVFYGDKIFEMYFWGSGPFGYDYECSFSEKSIFPSNIFPPTIHRPYKYLGGYRCQCGATAVKSAKHSSWCPKYVKDDS